MIFEHAVQIQNKEGKILFQINMDGTVEGSITDASEAAKLFCDAVADIYQHSSAYYTTREIEVLLNDKARLEEQVRELRRHAETGLEYIIEVANEYSKKNKVFDQVMLDLKRVEAALTDMDTDQ